MTSLIVLVLIHQRENAPEFNGLSLEIFLTSSKSSGFKSLQLPSFDVVSRNSKSLAKRNVVIACSCTFFYRMVDPVNPNLATIPF